MLLFERKSMEINKIVKKIDNLSISLYNAINNDIDGLCKNLCQELDIFKRGQMQHIISPEELKQIIKKYLVINLEPKFCQGITKQNNRCTRKAILDSKYCQSHTNKYYLHNNNNTCLNNVINNNTTEQVTITALQTNAINKNRFRVDDIDMKTKFIGDTFYYTDNKYIYDKNTLDKIGYVNGKDYILTDDPFILDELD